MRAPRVWVVVRRGFYGSTDTLVAYVFDEKEAGDLARRLDVARGHVVHDVEDVPHADDLTPSADVG